MYSHLTLSNRLINILIVTDDRKTGRDEGISEVLTNEQILTRGYGAQGGPASQCLLVACNLLIMECTSTQQTGDIALVRGIFWLGHALATKQDAEQDLRCTWAAYEQDGLGMWMIGRP